MWPLLEHPGPNPTSKPLLPGHQLVFPLQAQICLPAPQILPQKSQRLGLPTETDPRLSTGEVWHWIPNKTLQNPRAHFAKPGSWEHGQVVLPAAGLAPFRSVPPAETRSGCTSLLCSLPTQLRLPFQQPPEEKSHPPGTNATIYRHQQSEWRIRKETFL